VIFDIGVSLDGFMTAATASPKSRWVMVGSAYTSGRWPTNTRRRHICGTAS